jgi:hypothetical protein
MDAAVDFQKPARRKAGRWSKHSDWKRFIYKESSHDTSAHSEMVNGRARRSRVDRTARYLPNMSGFNPDKRAEQLVPAITLFDGLDGVIFPL